MTFNTKSAAEVQMEQRQSDHSVARAAAVMSYTRHPGDDAKAAESIWHAIP
jgi:hypothetical protein